MKAKNILILGVAGYLGRPLKDYLESKGHTVLGIDNGDREKNVSDVGSASLAPLKEQQNVLDASTLNFKELKKILLDFQPDAIVHLAEQPSAPFSMIDVQHATDTQNNNIIGTLNVLWAIKEVCPDTHLIKLGTAGEYPDWLYKEITVPEGSRITVNYQGKDWEIPTPRYAGSWYHFSKLHDSYNIDYACRIWGLRATDLNQGVVYGHIDGTRFDYDQYFGTVVNRFVTQAVAGIPLTIYGEGGQTRGFININNSMHAIGLVIDNPAEKGEFRVIHQLTETHSVKNIADLVHNVTGCEIEYIENPRAELPQNILNFEAKKLKGMGLKPIHMADEIENMIKFADAHKNRIRPDVIRPNTKWV